MLTVFIYGLIIGSVAGFGAGFLMAFGWCCKMRLAELAELSSANSSTDPMATDAANQK